MTESFEGWPAELRRATAHRHDAIRDLGIATVEQEAVIRAALADGMPETEAARLSGRARMTIRKLAGK